MTFIFEIQLFKLKLTFEVGCERGAGEKIKVVTEDQDLDESCIRHALNSWVEEISTSDIGLKILNVPVYKQDWSFSRRVGQIMSRLGWELVFLKARPPYALDRRVWRRRPNWKATE